MNGNEPSQLPTNWVLTTLGEAFVVNPRPAGGISDEEIISFVPMPAVEAMTGRIDTSRARPFREVSKGFTRFAEGDVLFAIAHAAKGKEGSPLHLHSPTVVRNADQKDRLDQNPRLLKQTGQLAITRVSEINKGSSPGKVISKRSRPVLPSPSDVSRGDPLNWASGRRPRGYSEREKEQFALWLLEVALTEPGNTALRDLTGVKGFGADAADELRRLFEIKAHGGEIPDSIRIEASQIQRALKSGQDFFLAVFGGLEDDYESIVLRVFAKPLSTLDWQSGTQVQLKGVNSKYALEIVFEDVR